MGVEIRLVSSMGIKVFVFVSAFAVVSACFGGHQRQQQQSGYGGASGRGGGRHGRSASQSSSTEYASDQLPGQSYASYERSSNSEPRTKSAYDYSFNSKTDGESNGYIDTGSKLRYERSASRRSLRHEGQSYSDYKRPSSESDS